MTTLADRAIQQAASEALAEQRELQRVRRGEAKLAEIRLAYARDPFRPIDEERIKVWTGRQLEPMRLSDQNRELLAAWIDCEHVARTGELRFSNVHVEKSRQVWDTTSLAYACLWAVTYHDVALLMQHQDLTEVADGGEDATWDSFFGKIRLLWQHWPEEIGRAELRVRGKPPLIRNLARDHAYIVGEGETPDPGRGGTYNGAVVDEASRISYGEAALAALNRACPNGRCYLSTPDGEDNTFFRLKTVRPKGMTFLRHHWSGNPVYGEGAHVAGSRPKTCEACAGNKIGRRWDPQNPTGAHRYPGKLASPWYDLAVVELTDEQVARELDIDYSASLSARIFPEFQEELHLAAVEIPYDPNLNIELGFDYGSDTTAVCICQEAPKEYRVIGEVELHDTMPEEVVRALHQELRELGMSERELNPVLTREFFAVGDPAGEARSPGGGVPAVHEYAKLGIAISSRRLNLDPTIRAVKRLLQGRPKELVISQRCPLFLDHMKHARRETDRQGNPKPAAQPKNDRHWHMMSGFRYLVSYKWPAPEVAEETEDATSTVTGGSGRLDPDGFGYGDTL